MSAAVDFEVANAIDSSWISIKAIPNHVEIAGELLFRKIFEIAPGAMVMFSFGPDFVGKEEELYKSERFKRHAALVIHMLDHAVNMIGPDLEPATKTLAELGAKHVAYGVLPAHYGIVGQALLHTLETALGEKWTPVVKKGWTQVYAFVSTAMIAGANRHLQKSIRRKERTIARRKGKSDALGGDKKPDGPTIPDVLFKLTGQKPEAQPQRLQNLANLIGNGLDVVDEGNEGDEDDLTQTTSSTDSLVEGEVNFMKIVESVYRSWDIVKRIPNYTEVAGVLLFRNIFEIAPQAKGLFPFAQAYEANDEALFKDPQFLVHATGVVKMLDVAVNMLGPDLEPVTKALEDLGARHCQYDVVAAHYVVVGEALMKTLEAALGDAWTPTVKEGWTGIVGFVSSSMQKGAADFLEEKFDEYHDL